MKKLVYLFEPTLELARALDEIKNRFMTFISYESTADGYLEVEIVCRLKLRFYYIAYKRCARSAELLRDIKCAH